MRKALLVFGLILLLACWGCSSSDDDNGGTDPNVSAEDQAAADEGSTETMGDMMEEMESVMGEDIDPEDLEALMDMDLDPYTEGFEAALDLDPNCGPAHFGLAFLEMVAMGQDEGLQDLIDDFDGEMGGMELPLGAPLAGFSTGHLLSDGLLGHSFSIMHRAPLALSPQELPVYRSMADKDGEPLIRNLQTYIHDVTLPATQSIVNHLSAAENDPDFMITIISGVDEPDTVEIDLGEVYILDAVVRALRSGLLVATAYDVELAPDGDYSWITDAFVDTGYSSFEISSVISAPDTLFLTEDEEVTMQPQIEMLAGLEGLLTPGSHFLTLWTNPWSGENAMQSAHNEIQTLLDKLEASYVFIQAEEDDQDHDLITQYLLAELDAAILEIGGDLPEYLGTFETIPDVIDWVDGILSGPYTIPIEISETETFDLTVNISNLFVNPVNDWKTKLPYMAWLDVEDWFTYDETDVYGPYAWSPGTPFNALVNGVELAFNDIGVYYLIEVDWDMGAPFQFLDGPDGDPLEDDFFYFPDYTFGGLFPDMDRDDWMTLLELL